MKPPPFEYRAPETVADVLALLAEAPAETSLLAGGQSLVPLLNLRLARPTVVVDLNRVQGLNGIETLQDGRLRIGAMVRQRAIETDATVRQRVPVLSEAAAYIAHIPIRTRGTVGGSLAHADPSAELPPTVAALGADMVLRTNGTTRSLASEEFFVGALTTAIEPGELLVAIEMDAPPSGTGHAFVEVTRTHGAFALVGAAALLHTAFDGRIDFARLALCGVGGVPYVPSWIEDETIGEHVSEALVARVAERVREDVEAFGDGHAGPEYRKRVAGVVAARALVRAAARAGQEVAA